MAASDCIHLGVNDLKDYVSSLQSRDSLAFSHTVRNTTRYVIEF